MEITKILAKFIHDTNFEDIPADVIEKSKRCFLDCQGVALAGIKEDSSRIIIEYISETGGKDQATIIGTNIMTDVEHAALANGVISHALDFDDYHSETVIHASAACLPAIMAVAENRNLSGKDVLTALTIGIDIAVRIGLGLGAYHYERGWHTTSTAGVFGATAGVAKLLKLDENKIVNAFGLCGTQSSGLRQVFGTMTKPFHAGISSRNGVMSAFLAEKGFTSAREIIEGELGLLDVLTDTPDQERILEGLSSKFYVADMSIKPYPT